MGTFMMLVFTVGGGLWAYRQWQALHPPHNGGVMVVRPGNETVTEAGEWQAASPPRPKPKINKYVMFVLCALYIVCPIDVLPDFIPVLGWGDDVAAAVIGIKALFREA